MAGFVWNQSYIIFFGYFLTWRHMILILVCCSLAQSISLWAEAFAYDKKKACPWIYHDKHNCSFFVSKTLVSIFSAVLKWKFKCTVVSLTTFCLSTAGELLDAQNFYSCSRILRAPASFKTMVREAKYGETLQILCMNVCTISLPSCDNDESNCNHVEQC